MIRTHVRVRGASELGATTPGQPGPFGVRPDEDDGDGLDDEPDDQDHDS